MFKGVSIFPGDTFVVTGFYYNTQRRFRRVCANWTQANGINLWRGNVWHKSAATGKRTLVKSVYN